MLEVGTVIYLIAHISTQAVRLWLRIQKEQEELDRQTERKMDLLNTLTIDSGSDAMRDQFTKLINDNSFIVFIVFGNDDAAKALVELADFIADDHQGKFARRVIWVQDKAFLEEDTQDFLKTFDGDEPADFEWDDVLAFVLSPRWHEAKYVFIKGDVCDDFQIAKAYWKASLREREIA